MLGITIDKELTFIPHIKELCSRTNLKTKALLRIRNNLSDSQAKLLYNAYIFSNFLYCPIVWMFTNKEGYNLLKRTHHKSLKAVYNKFNQDYETLTLSSGNPNIHILHLQKLATEVYKFLNCSSPSKMKNLLIPKVSNRTLRGGNLLKLPLLKNTNAWLFRSILLWNNLPVNIKECTSVNIFKTSIKTANLYCNCKICT